MWAAISAVRRKRFEFAELDLILARTKYAFVAAYDVRYVAKCAFASIIIHVQTGNHRQFVCLVEEIKMQSQHGTFPKPEHFKSTMFIISLEHAQCTYSCNASTKWMLSRCPGFIGRNSNLSDCRTVEPAIRAPILVQINIHLLAQYQLPCARISPSNIVCGKILVVKLWIWIRLPIKTSVVKV